MNIKYTEWWCWRNSNATVCLLLSICVVNHCNLSAAGQTSEGVLANFFNSLLTKKSGTGPPGTPGGNNTPGTVRKSGEYPTSSTGGCQNDVFTLHPSSSFSFHFPSANLFFVTSVLNNNHEHNTWMKICRTNMSSLSLYLCVALWLTHGLFCGFSLLTPSILSVCMCTSQRMLAALRCVWETLLIHPRSCMSLLVLRSIHLFPVLPHHSASCFL